MRICIYLLVTFIMIHSSSMFGECAKGHRFYNLLRYHEAIISYELCLNNTDKPDAKSVLQLANAYRIIDDYTKAALWYKVGMKITSIEMNSRIGFIQMSHAAGNIEMSQKALDSLIIKYPKNKDLIQLKQSLNPTMAIDSFKIQKTNFNSTEADYASTTSQNKVIFSSSRPSGAKEDNFTGQNFSSLWQVDHANNNALPIPFDLNQKTKYNIGAATFSSDGNTIYFTTNVNKADKKGLVRLTIMTSSKVNDVWQLEQECSFAKSMHNCVHPAISPDGSSIVFSTDKLGNHYDLYISSQTSNGHWSTPRILPKTINTSGNEVFATWIDDQTLLFSSDGHSKWAGLDLYRTQYTNGQWSTPSKLPKPFNSLKDDYSLSSTDTTLAYGYFTSNRDDPKGNEDIYSFSKIVLKKCLVQVQLIDVASNTSINTPFIMAIENRQSFANMVNNIGHISLFEDETLSINANYQGTLYDTTLVSKPSCATDTAHIKWYYRNPNMIISATVIDDITKSPLSNAIITITDEKYGHQTIVTSDQNGQFSKSLLRDQSYIILAKKDGYYGEAVRLRPTDSNSHEKITLRKIDINSIFVLKNVLYDYNKSDINEIAAIEMERLKEFMLQNPTVTIEISSHTDATGNDVNNMKLSLYRAQAAVDYLIGRGISASRLVAKGYGESILLNYCTNGVLCTEEEHQINRRTEFKILQK